jgi:hypothetical protein
VAWVFDTKSTELTETDADATLTLSHTMGSILNGILFAWAVYQTTSTVPTAAYGGEAMTIAIQQTTNRRTVLAYSLGPPAGAANIVWSGSGNFGRACFGSHSWAGANATQDLTSKTSAGASTSNNPSLTVPTAVGELIVDVLGYAFQSGDTLAVETNQTERGKITGGATTGASSSQLGDDGGVMSWLNSASRAWGYVGASFAPASEAGGGIITPVFGREGIVSANFGGLVVR